LTRVVAPDLGPAARILRDAAGFRCVCVVLLVNANRSSIPRRCRFTRAVAIDRECGGARGAFEAISRQIGYACRNANLVHELLAVNEFQSYERRRSMNLAAAFQLAGCFGRI
jgi:hypothetical protein